MSAGWTLSGDSEGASVLCSGELCKVSRMSSRPGPWAQSIHSVEEEPSLSIVPESGVWGAQQGAGGSEQSLTGEEDQVGVLTLTGESRGSSDGEAAGQVVPAEALIICQLGIVPCSRLEALRFCAGHLPGSSLTSVLTCGHRKWASLYHWHCFSLQGSKEH